MSGMAAKEKSQSKIGLIAAVVVIAAGAVMLVVYFSGPSAAAKSARHRVFIDAETGKSFEVDLAVGMTYPVKSPDTGHMSGQPAELCYWTADGQPKATPDPVLLNNLRMPPVDGPTFCPVCHRLVVGNNPGPAPGRKPPPTEAEYTARYGNRTPNADR
jgi:hypothetical protein